MLARLGFLELGVRGFHKAAMPPGGVGFCAVAVAAVLLACMFGRTSAAQLRGYVDGVGTDYINGWSCATGAGQPSAVALYAGTHRVGIFSSNESRPDTAYACNAHGSQTGFQIGTASLLAQQFYGQTSLSIYALRQMQAPVLLPPSNAGAADPDFLPSGFIGGISFSGGVSGLVSKSVGNNVPPTVAIYYGGPTKAGGTYLGNAAISSAGKLEDSFSFASLQLHEAFANAPAGYLSPVFAYASFGSGPAVQIGSPAVPGAVYEPLSAQVVQSGAQSGLTNTFFTRWVSGNKNFSGLSGSILFQGNSAGFSEALITVGFTSDGQQACQQRNQTSQETPPPFARLVAFIMKGTDTSADTIPVNVVLPYGLPLAGGAGTCLLTWISAGYANLVPESAKYTIVMSNVFAVLTPPVAGAPARFAEGVGNEFTFSGGSAVPLYTVVAMKMLVPADLDAIAGSVSVAGVADAPAGSTLLPIPTVDWVANTDFYVFGSADCAGLGLSFGNPTAFYTVGLNKNPTLLQIPAGARLLINAPLFGMGGLASQSSFLQTFQNAAQLGASLVTLAPDDCLVALHSVTAPGNGLDGTLDFENQSTAYFHVVGQ